MTTAEGVDVRVRRWVARSRRGQILATAFFRGSLPATVLAAAAVLVVCTAAPTLPTGNLLNDPGAEAAAAATNDTAVVPIPGWTTNGGFTSVRYGAQFAGGSFPAALEGGGQNFFAGGPESTVATATQKVDVARWAGEIDGPGVVATLSALIGGLLDRPDEGQISATFLAASGDELGRLTIGPVTAAQRENKTRLVPLTGTLKVPPQTRAIEVVLLARRVSGFYNDAYFDNVSLNLAPAGR